MIIGDKVIMNGKYKVSEKNKGRVFTVKRFPFDICGKECVQLREYRGCYPIKGHKGCYPVDGLTNILYSY